MLAPVYTVILMRFIPANVPVFYVLDAAAKGNTDVGGLALISVYFLMLGIAEVLLFCGVSGIVLLLGTVVKRQYNTKYTA